VVSLQLGEKGLCGSVSMKAGEAVVKPPVFHPLSSCTSISSGLLTLNNTVCSALGQPEHSQIERDQLFERYSFLKFT